MPIALLLLALNAGPVPFAPALKGHALCVGVDRFDAQADLRYAGRDAAAVGRILQAEYGLDVTVMNQELARSKPHLAPDSRRVKRQLRDMLDSARPGDTVVFLFSGHGGQDPGVKDVSLILADSRGSEPSSELSMSELYRMFARSRASQKLILLDACRRTGSEDQVEAARRPKLPALDLPPPPAGVVVLLSCAADETSSEPDILGHGVFTYFLLKELRRAAQAAEVVSSNTLFLASAGPTERMMRNRNNQAQTPQRQARGGTEVLLAPPGGAQLRAGLRAVKLRRYREAEDALTSGMGEKKTARLLAERSLARVSRGDRKGAARDAEEALKLAPDYPLALRARAEAHMAHGEMHKALQACTRALRIDPAYAPAYISRSSVFLELGETGRGLDDAEVAARLDPESDDALFQRASARDWSYLDRLAADDFRAFLKRRPGHPDAMRALARLTEDQVGRREYEVMVREAAAILRRDLAADPDDQSAALGLAGALKDLRRFPEAEKLLTALAKRWPDDHRVLLSQSDLYQSRGEHSKAQAANLAAARLAPELPLPLVFAARASTKLKQKEKALELLAAAMKLCPFHADAVWERAQILEEDDPHTALEELSQVVARNPNNWMAYYARGRLARESGSPGLALADFAEASRLAGNDPTPRCQRGRVLRMLGRLDEALAEYAQAEKLAPKSPLVYAWRAATHTARKNHAAAVLDCERALELDPESPDLLEQLGRAFHDAGRYEDAARALRQALARGAHDPEVELYLGLARLHLGEWSVGLFGKAEGKEAREYADLLTESATGSLAPFNSHVRSRPDDFVGYFLRARVHLNRKEPDQALANAEALLKMHPLSPSGHVVKARALAAKGEVRQAISELDRAILLASQQPHLYLERAALHDKAGDPARAKADRDKAASLRKRP
jgi:tetratricopeptide (TPR) repeat protein